MRGQQTESGESSDECVREPHLGAKTPNEQNIYWPSLCPSCRPIRLWAGLHLGSLNSIHGSPIPRAPCQSEESEELRATVYTWYIMSKRSVAYSCDPTAPPLFRTSHVHRPRGLEVDRPPSISGRSLEIVVLRASFSLVCVSPRNCGWHSNSQLTGTLLAIHGTTAMPYQWNERNRVSNGGYSSLSGCAFC